ncbi:DUF488 family protein [Lactobacillus delbrueckii]|uniref:DUF488 domain-containing protein n=1 Tax=Lactobacillus delbrueckii TaxID=1584 RepID=UPI001C702824|nr:DUF488 family protein [Lactobacillus delbrueckii]MBW9308479.1 DUF488 family protein [Lactobacillus delbrueckii]
MSTIKTVRIYAKEQTAGYRILVDRLWPRGIKKEAANLDEWKKELAPSRDLRTWFKHDPARYTDFRQDYLEELADNPEWPPFVEHLQELLQKGDVLFLYGAKDEEHNQAVVLKEAAEEALAKLP